ncbi:MAG: hypothetical protein GEV03_24560 [Streptosporangiales bacterium]|nr:hypothetical protein [Streptosporangiales bacterium]
MTRPARTRQTRHAGDVHFTVTSAPEDAPALASYFDDYLTGPPGELDLPNYQLDIRTETTPSPAAGTHLTSGAATPIEPIPGVVLLQHTTPAGWRRYTLTHDAVENAPGAWTAAIQGRVIDLSCRQPQTAPRYALRIIREVMMRSYENAGGVIFHAAGVDLGGDAVMICGTGGAGKTTTMTAILRRAGSNGALLSNDRLTVHGTDRIVAVPLPVRAARGTIDAFPELHAAATPVNLADLPPEFGTQIKAAFPARRYAAAFGADLSPGARLAAVLVCSFTDDARPAHARRLGREQARAALAQACFTPRDEFWRPWLLPRHHSDAVLAESAAHTCARIAATVPCIRVRFGVRNPLDHLDRLLGTALADLTPNMTGGQP